MIGSDDRGMEVEVRMRKGLGDVRGMEKMRKTNEVTQIGD